MEPDPPLTKMNRESTSVSLAGPAEPVPTELPGDPGEAPGPRAETHLESTADPAVVGAAATEPSIRSGGPLRLLGYLVAGMAGVALTVAVLAGSGSIGAGSVVPTAPPTTAPSAPPTPAPTFGFDGYSMGVASAPVTIEIWADYQCPYCGLLAHGIEPSLVREIAVTGKARIQYRDFAFLGQESVDAAVAASCADREGLFWRYHDLLFASQNGENQGAFARDRLLSLARFAGVADMTAFTACLDDRAVAQKVTTESEEGRSYGVNSTPTIRIVGPGATQLIEGVTDPAKILAAVARASTPAPASSPGAGSTPSPGAGSSGGSGSSPVPSPAPS